MTAPVLSILPKPRVAVGYIRCSTDMQAETSPEQQRNLILEWAHKSNYTLIDWYVDIGKSGTSFEKRPAFARLMSVIASKPNFNAVIALDESRWGRAGASDSIYYKTHFKKVANVDVVMVRTIANTGNSTFDTMLGAFEGGLSYEESKKKSERTYDGCLSAVKAGHSAGGTAPYGYRRVGINRFTGQKRVLGAVLDQNGIPMSNDKGLPITEQIRPKEEFVVWEPGDPDEIQVVKRIYDLRVKYRYGYTKIAKLLNSENVPCPKRGKWSNKNQRWSAGTIGAIVRNPAYMGARVYDRQKKKSIGKFSARYWVKDKSQWTIIETAHEGLVSKEQWTLANPEPKASGYGRLAGKRFDNPYLLSGLIKCSHCGFSFNGRAQLWGRPGNRKKRRVYVDSGNISKGPSVCDFMSIEAEKFELDILNAVKSRILNSRVISVVERLVSYILERRMGNPRSRFETIDTEIAEIQSRIKSLLTVVENGVQLEEISVRLGELKTRKERLEAKRQSIDTSYFPNEGAQAIVSKVGEFFGNFAEKFQTAPISEQKALLNQLVHKIIIDRERNVARCYLLKLPRNISPVIDEMISGSGTPLYNVPPREHSK